MFSFLLDFISKISLGFIDFSKEAGNKHTNIITIYTYPRLSVLVNGPINLVPIITDKFAMAM